MLSHPPAGKWGHDGLTSNFSLRLFFIAGKNTVFTKCTMRSKTDRNFWVWDFLKFPYNKLIENFIYNETLRKPPSLNICQWFWGIKVNLGNWPKVITTNLKILILYIFLDFMTASKNHIVLLLYFSYYGFWCKWNWYRT